MIENMRKMNNMYKRINVFFEKAQICYSFFVLSFTEKNTVYCFIY